MKSIRLIVPLTLVAGCGAGASEPAQQAATATVTPSAVPCNLIDISGIRSNKANRVDPSTLPTSVRTRAVLATDDRSFVAKTTRDEMIDAGIQGSNGLPS